MSASPILTLGIGAFTDGGVQFIPTIGYGTGATPPPPIVTRDTHDGFDEDSHRKAKESQGRHDKDFRSARQRLRETLERAWGEPEPGPVAAEVRAAAAPYVEQLESGALRVNYAALERRNAEVMAQVLAFENELRAEFEARMLASDDEEVMLLTWD